MDSKQHSADTEQWTIGRLLNWTGAFLARKGVDEPKLAAQILLAEAMGWKKVDLFTHYDHCPNGEQLGRYRDMVKQAAAGRPIAYLVGKKEFFSIEFKVNDAVLIPRPETEVLVQWVIRRARQEDLAGKPLRVLDLCTGSGCVAVALARYLPAVESIVAVDVSADALTIAGENARTAGVADKIRFLRGNLVQPVAADSRFHFIVSNPPYVSDAEFERLPAGIRNYEPTIALLAGPTGLEVIRQIVDQAPPLLENGGYLAVEVAYGQAERVMQLYRQAGLSDVVAERDTAGIERVICGRHPAGEST